MESVFDLNALCEHIAEESSKAVNEDDDCFDDSDSLCSLFDYLSYESDYSLSDDELSNFDNSDSPGKKHVTFSKDETVILYDPEESNEETDYNVDSRQLWFRLKIAQFEKMFMQTMWRRNLLLTETVSKLEQENKVLQDTITCQRDMFNGALDMINFYETKLAAMTSNQLVLNHNIEEYVERECYYQTEINDLTHELDQWRNLITPPHSPVAEHGFEHIIIN